MQGIVNKQTMSHPLISQELNEALKKLEGVDDTQKKDLQQGEESSQAQLRSVDEIKGELAMLDLQVETDVQIISKLLSKFNSTNVTMDQKVTALHDLEYLVHQVDNAHNLVLMGGMELVKNALNSTDFRLQENAAFVLGSAISSNPSVHAVALEGGTLLKLSTMLATSRPMSVKKKVLFALACLLRYFPPAQSQFVKLGGLQLLVDLFQTPEAESLRVRIITLLYDMITEMEMISQIDVERPSTYQEHLQHYGDISLFPMLVEQGWCRLVPEMLTSPKHDWREKALHALLAMMPHCQTLYLQNAMLRTHLNVLHKQYQDLAIRERSLGEDNGYFGEILVLVDSIIVKMQ